MECIHNAYMYTPIGVNMARAQCMMKRKVWFNGNWIEYRCKSFTLRERPLCWDCYKNLDWEGSE